MISPHTPPGTKVEIHADTSIAATRMPGVVGDYVRNGQIFTLASWRDEEYCYLSELPLFGGRPIACRRFGLRRVTDITQFEKHLHSAPVDDKVLA